MTEAPPDVQTGCGAMVTMKLAATELDAQKQEIAALNKKFGEVKREVKEHLDMLGELFEEVVEGAEDASFFPEEREALMMLQGAMLEILDTLDDDTITAAEAHAAPPLPAPRPLAPPPLAQPLPTPQPAAAPPAAAARPHKPAPPASHTAKAGWAVKEALLKVVKLRHAGKKGSAAEAKKVLEGIPAGKTVQASMLDKIAKSLEAQVFRVGGMETMKAVV